MPDYLFRGYAAQGVSNMNKTELIDAVAESADLSKADAALPVDAVISPSQALKKGDNVTVGARYLQERARAQRAAIPRP